MYTFSWTEEKQKRTLAMLDSYFKKFGQGGAIMQSDEGQELGLNLLCDIADEVLEAEYVDEDEL